MTRRGKEKESADSLVVVGYPTHVPGETGALIYLDRSAHNFALPVCREWGGLFPMWITLQGPHTEAVLASGRRRLSEGRPALRPGLGKDIV